MSTGRTTVAASEPREAALPSLRRGPSPVAARGASGKVDAGATRRKFPRADLKVRARLALADAPERFFEATLSTSNISVGGMFLESEFFLKLGTRLLVELVLPPRDRPVKVKGSVVRIETNDRGTSGFALRFTEYFEGSHVALATHFLSPMLRTFITEFSLEHDFEAGAEYIAHTIDVISAWELRKAELGDDVWALAGPA